MAKQKVTDEQILEYLENPSRFGSRADAARLFGIATTVLKRRIRRMRESGMLDGFEKRYVITSAQNNTNLHHGFWEALQVYCRTNDAELVVIPTAYLNVSLFRAGEQEVWYPHAVVPYLCEERRALNANLVVMGDVKVQPTAVNPLSGFDTITADKSGIFGHPQVALKTVATPGLKLPKVLATTGTVSLPNYSDTKAGKKGEHHHSFGALVVEIRGRLFFTRQVTADVKTGAFYDLDKHYTSKGVTGEHRAAGIVYGDLHEWRASEKVKAATWGTRGSVVDVLKPRVHVIHDALDFHSRNHHHGPIDKHIIHHTGEGCVRTELDSLAMFHGKHLADDAEVVYVDSNHNRALDRWLDEAKPDADPLNAVIYHELRLAQIKAAEKGERINPLEHYLLPRIRKGQRVRFLKGNEPYDVAGIDVSHHGDRGANGARGSAAQFTRVGGPVTVGHSHAPCIDKLVHQVGTSSQLNMGYNVGLSAWLQSHDVIYPDGTRSLLHIIDGQWRL